MLDPEGRPVKRNFVHVEDLVSAILLSIENPKARQQTFNVCMDEPVDYRKVAEYLHETQGLPSVEVKTQYHSTWLDNTKAKFLLDWKPKIDMKQLIDKAWSHDRPKDDPRKSGTPANQDIPIPSLTKPPTMNKLSVLAAFVFALVISEAKTEKSPDPENLLTLELESGLVVIELFPGDAQSDQADQRTCKGRQIRRCGLSSRD